MKNSIKSHLEDTSDSIINGTNPIEDLDLKISRLHKKLEDYDVNSLWDHQKDTKTPNGRCLSPIEAGNCMLDTKRTVEFIRGLHDAVKEAQKRNPEKRISVLYAGCGPFAALALPMTTQFTPQEVGFTLMDIHGGSLTYVARIIEELGLHEYIDDVICTDATEYHPKEKYDVLVTETMDRALLYEPHLAITENLRNSLHENGILVPEKITLGIELKNMTKRAGGTIHAGDFFTLEKDSEPTSPPGKIEGKVELDSRANETDIYKICITTRVQVFGTHALELNDSMITYIEETNECLMKKPGTTIRVKYKAGDNKESIKIYIRPH